jgi:cytochrome c peroxidase
VEGSQHGRWFFWDGRADSLWSQALGPIENPDEMGNDRLAVVRAVTGAYSDAWRALFGEVPDFSDRARFPEHARPDPSEVHPHRLAWEAMSAPDRRLVDENFVRIGKVLGAFERLILPGESAFDRYAAALAAGDPRGGGALSPEAEAGLRLFVGRAACVSCHSGPMFSDRAFHNLGLPEHGGYDPGRTVGATSVLDAAFNCRSEWSDTADCPELVYLNPAFPDFQAAFKTPTLRNVTETAPYMHNGQFTDLNAVLSFYSDLPGEPMMGHRELTLRPLKLTEAERGALIAFLGALTAPVSPAALPDPIDAGPLVFSGADP